jgi:hypothetical protein
MHYGAAIFRGNLDAIARRRRGSAYRARLAALPWKGISMADLGAELVAGACSLCGHRPGDEPHVCRPSPARCWSRYVIKAHEYLDHARRRSVFDVEGVAVDDQPVDERQLELPLARSLLEAAERQGPQ